MPSCVFTALLLCCLSLPVTAAQVEIERGGQRLTLDLHASLAATRQGDLVDWVTTVSNALATVYGRWPRDEWRVQVRPVGATTNDPVPWAQVNRGNPDVVSLYIDSEATTAKLIGNWTAYHEFSHLLIPYRGWGDVWFSEGLASYYQNLLQARSGVFDEQAMWQKLYDGFQRGRDNRYPQLSLSELSNRLRKTGSYMRVYWSGALFFLRADTELRRRSNGETTLDDALLALNRCCADDAMSVPGMVQRLDDLLGEPLFLPLYERTAASRDIGDFEADLHAIGIAVNGGRVSPPPGGTGWLGDG